MVFLNTSNYLYTHLEYLSQSPSSACQAVFSVGSNYVLIAIIRCCYIDHVLIEELLQKLRA